MRSRSPGNDPSRHQDVTVSPPRPSSADSLRGDHDTDRLYAIFDRHLHHALIEDETTDEFLTLVVEQYLGELVSQNAIIQQAHRQSIEADLKEEVLEMLRKKTYGHYSLSAFRQAKRAAANGAAEVLKKTASVVAKRESATAAKKPARRRASRN